MSIPEAAIAAFLAAHGLGGARRHALKGDASFRAYERIAHGGKSFILMKAPPARESTRPFSALADFLTGQGFSAPKVLGQDYAGGLLLLEDLGDDLYTALLKQTPALEGSLYEAAIDLLLALHEIEPPEALPVKGEGRYSLKPYGEALLFRELALFSDWYLPELGVTDAAAIKAELETLLRPLIAEINHGPRVVTLRDYHADNLMWLPARAGIARVGLLDFQDAVAGHPAYDLVSLLQDARRPYDAGLEQRMIARYLAAAGRAKIPRADFIQAYQALGAQRNLKIIGIFTRLMRRDGKGAFPRMIPHVWSLLGVNLAHPALAKLKVRLGEVVPQARRGQIPAEGPSKPAEN